MSYAYAFSDTVVTLAHGHSLPHYLRDSFEDQGRLDLQAQLRSGHYFAMLASKLDALSDQLGRDTKAEKAYLQRLADELLYLQRQYKVTKK